MKPLATAFAELAAEEPPERREYAETMFYHGALAAVRILGEKSASGDPQAVSQAGAEIVGELEEFFNETPPAPPS